jgi:hypothetical protein
MLPKNFRVLELEPNIIVSCDNIIFNWLSVSPISLMIERSSDAVCGLHHAQGDEEREFLGLDSKPRSTVFPSLASKPVAMVLVVWHPNWQLWFADLAHKITTTVSWFEPQNQVGCDLSVAPQNREEDEDGVGHALRSSGLFA